MMIEVSNEFLDFDDVIEIEKQIKLFEDISSTDGDYSYAFDIPKTLNNKRLLGNPMPDNISKPVYQRIPAKILSNTGAKTYDGYIRVERITQVYSCSFFAGNNNWFAQIDGLLSDLDLSRFDVEQTIENIISSWSQSEGVVFPLVDNGPLLTRSLAQIKIEDLVGGFYVKTIFNQIFSEAGIKVNGDLLSDWRFNNAICLKNSRSEDEINARSSYVEKTTTQAHVGGTPVLMTWENDSIYPFYDGREDNFDLAAGKYVADIKMTVDIDVFIRLSVVAGPGPAARYFIHLYVNGAQTQVKEQAPATGGVFGAPEPFSASFTQTLNAGDEVTIYVSCNFEVLGEGIDVLSGTLKITPAFLYKVFGKSGVPNWTKQQFVSNILRMFNVLASYKESNATLTLDLMELIKTKEPIDLSEFISSTTVDYSEFISDYGQRSRLGYQELDFEELKTYNQGKFFKYGQGIININNEFIEPDVEILLSDFANPFAYVNSVFDTSIEKTNLVETEEGDDYPFTDVGDDGTGAAAFNIGDTSNIQVGDLIRISDSINTAYNGDWIVKSVDGVHVIFEGVPYSTASTGSLVKLNYTYTSSDDVFILINIPNYELSNFSEAEITLYSSGFTPVEVDSVALAYFDMINTGKQVNRDFIYSLSFGGIDDPLHYQVTMLESYFRLFSRVLNDPVKLICTAHLPYHLFVQIDFLSPVTIKTMESTNQYYLNRISGFKESFLPTELELIKLP